MKTKGNQRVVLIAAIAAMIWALSAGCATVPVTGRRELDIVSDQQLNALSLAEFDKMKQQMPISRDPQANAMVQRVGRRIASVADLPGAHWEFVVFDSQEANAFCLPGGKVGVYSGILPIAENDAGLATVLGHEIAHAVAHHGAERMSEALVEQTGGQVISAALSGSSPAVQSLFPVVYGLGTQLGRVLPHSRAQEAEADHIGLIYMAKAGYNPEEALAFWKRFAAAVQQTGRVPVFLQDHPLTQDRIAALEKEMPQALAAFRESRMSGAAP